MYICRSSPVYEKQKETVLRELDAIGCRYVLCTYSVRTAVYLLLYATAQAVIIFNPHIDFIPSNASLLSFLPPCLFPLLPSLFSHFIFSFSPSFFPLLTSSTPIVELWNKIDSMEDPESVRMEAMYMPVGEKEIPHPLISLSYHLCPFYVQVNL